MKPRRPAAQLAAHLAYLLNTGSAVVEVNPFALYLRLLQTLAGQGYGRLVGMGVVGAGQGAEEVAEGYFNAVFRRRLSLVRDEHTHKGHALLLALCRRGLGPVWPTAALGRGAAAEPGEEAAQTPADFADVARRLAQVDKSIAARNPAAGTRERRGPLYLAAGAGRAEVAEELSLWDAITCAPTRLGPLGQGHEFNAFCAVVIRAVEAANDAYGAYITLGLSPFDWADALTVNTATKLSAFRSELYKEGPNALHDFDAWRRAWTRRQVPGYRSADELWHSELGRALRGSRSGQPAPEAGGPEPDFLDESEFLKLLALCREAGIIDDFDAWLYREVWAGSTIEDLAPRPEVRRRFPGAAELAAHLQELTERVLDWVRRFLDDDDDSDPEPSR